MLRCITYLELYQSTESKKYIIIKIEDNGNGFNIDKNDNKDVLIIAQKIISKSEDRFIDLKTVDPSEKAIEVSKKTDKDPPNIMSAKS